MAVSDEPGTRTVTITVTAPTLSDAMDRTYTMLSTDDERVLEITDAGLKVGDTYVVTALLTDRSTYSVS